MRKIIWTSVLTLGLSGMAMAQNATLPDLPRRLPHLKELNMSAININTETKNIEMAPKMPVHRGQAPQNPEQNMSYPPHAYESGKAPMPMQYRYQLPSAGYEPYNSAEDSFAMPRSMTISPIGH